ncbi:MAG: family 43 glycosylhydrolase [Bacteroidetes bacterium]|nr:family 43 glycosylhydrolase [Bacteroidota bacterium]
MRSLLIIVSVLMAVPYCYSQHPIATDIYAADPSARVFNDTLYIYPSHDIEGSRWFDMRDWHVLSTTDMQTWTDHGVALSLDSLPWTRKYAWAPDCAYRNGKYYFYYPVDRDAIGVAVADRPYGPFHDPLGRALVTRQTPGVVESRSLIDPCVFTDDDGTAYLIFGQNEVNIVRLNEDMISFSDTARQVRGVDHFFEAVWMHKYHGKYYISYSGKGKILYGMGDSPYGPFSYKGVVLGKVNSVTNHASITEYKGQWYLFYHTSDKYINAHKGGRLSLKRYYSRSMCVGSLFYNTDGTIREVVPTRGGVPVSR